MSGNHKVILLSEKLFFMCWIFCPSFSSHEKLRTCSPLIFLRCHSFPSIVNIFRLFVCDDWRRGRKRFAIRFYGFAQKPFTAVDLLAPLFHPFFLQKHFPFSHKFEKARRIRPRESKVKICIIYCMRNINLMKIRFSRSSRKKTLI
jgi:hypothetical protein